MIRIKNPGWFYTLMSFAAVNLFFMVGGILFLLTGQEYELYSILLSAASTVFPAAVAFAIHTERTDEEPLRKVDIDE